MVDKIVASITVHPGELCAHPLNANTHSKQQIEELAESRHLLGQYKNVTVWQTPEPVEVETQDGESVTMKPGINYILAGHGFWEACKLRGDTQIEIKDRSDLSFDEAILLMETDNASPLGSVPDTVKMAANLERVRGLVVDNERMERMLERAREMRGDLPFDPDDIEFPEYDEDIADDVEFLECPSCGHKFPK